MFQGPKRFKKSKPSRPFKGIAHGKCLYNCILYKSSVTGFYKVTYSVTLLSFSQVERPDEVDADRHANFEITINIIMSLISNCITFAFYIRFHLQFCSTKM